MIVVNDIVLLMALGSMLTCHQAGTFQAIGQGSMRAAMSATF